MTSRPCWVHLATRFWQVNEQQIACCIRHVNISHASKPTGPCRHAWRHCAQNAPSKKVPERKRYDGCGNSKYGSKCAYNFVPNSGSVSKTCANHCNCFNRKEGLTHRTNAISMKVLMRVYWTSGVSTNMGMWPCACQEHTPSVNAKRSTYVNRK